MGERRNSGPHCSRCGAKFDGDRCPRCAGASRGGPVQLVALPGDDAPAPPGEVALLREIKGAAVKDPAMTSPLQQLARQGSTTPAVDEAPANLLRGPGYRRRHRLPWRWLLWLLALASCLLLWR